jgi:hypothetical protein
MNAWVAAGATAVLMSERGRNFLRRAAVYGVANVMNAGETFASAATDVAHGAERVASSAGDLAGDLVSEAQHARQEADGKTARPAPKSSRQSGRARSSRAKSAQAGAGG